MPLAAPGITVRPIRQLNGQTGFAEIFFDDVRVPVENRLAAEGAGVGCLIAENVADDVAAGRLAWTPLADVGARSFSCSYQRADMSATVAMTMFLEFFSEAI
ncbi:hypothetical protein NO135_20655, partial [Clostridioides difficile]|nr:hypothetical protein [Clostridioides difficile]